MDEQIEIVGRAVLDCAFKVHTVLGPGLLESVYEAALAIELKKRGHFVERQRSIDVSYEGESLDVGFRADLVIDKLVLAELKSVQQVCDLFKKIAHNYLRLIPLKLGFLINFNELHLRHGITRIVNGLEGKEFYFREDPVPYQVFPSQPSPLSRDSVLSQV